jgi:hypothetical protein
MEKISIYPILILFLEDLMPFLACWSMNAGTQAFARVGWQSST